MSFDPKYTVFKTCGSEEVKDHTLKDWDLLQVFQESALEMSADQVANPHSPPANYDWSNSNSHYNAGWKPFLTLTIYKPIKRLRFLLGQTQEKVTASWQVLTEQAKQDEWQIKNLNSKLEEVSGARDVAEKKVQELESLNRSLTNSFHTSMGAEANAKTANEALFKKNFNLELENNALRTRLQELEKLVPTKDGPTRIVET